MESLVRTKNGVFDIDDAVDIMMKTMQVKGLLFFVLAYGVLASAGCGGGGSEEQGASGPVFFFSVFFFSCFSRFSFRPARTSYSDRKSVV